MKLLKTKSHLLILIFSASYAIPNCCHYFLLIILFESLIYGPKSIARYQDPYLEKRPWLVSKIPKSSELIEKILVMMLWFKASLLQSFIHTIHDANTTAQQTRLEEGGLAELLQDQPPQLLVLEAAEEELHGGAWHRRWRRRRSLDQCC